MSNCHSPARTARLLTVLTTALAALTSLRAQTAPESLAPYVTSATRMPEPPQTVGSAVTMLSAQELADRQVTTISDALASVAGAPLFTSGAPGAETSLFLRGANSNQTLFLVDGIRLNDPNTDYQVFLGGALLGPGDRIEVLRGPQSTLYGAEAIGGVVSLSIAPGSGTPSGSIRVDAGSFGTVEGGISSQGAEGTNAWDFFAAGRHTDNARPNNRFDSENGALRFDHQLNAQVAVGGTVRWFHGELGSPGDTNTNDPNNHESEDNAIATAFVTAKIGSDWTTRLTVGAQNRRYTDNTPLPNPPYDSPAAINVVTNRRGVLDAQAVYSGVINNRLTAGVTGEAEQTRNNGFGAIDQNQRLFAIYAEDEYAPIENVDLTAGIRNDDFDTFGSATTGRGTIAWLPIPHTLKIRASYGTGFRSPSFLELYGQDQFFVGNPNLKPERSHGGDAGIDYYLPEHRGVLSATWFQTDTSDLINFQFAPFPQPSTEINVGRARMQGFELEARTTLPGGLVTTATYGYLEAQSLDPAGNSWLLRRPRDEASLDVHRFFGAGFSGGAGASYVGRRADVDAVSFGNIVDDAYTVVRIYAAWQVTAKLTLTARIENLFNRRYAPVNGYPALGRGAFAGLDWKF